MMLCQLFSPHVLVAIRKPCVSRMQALLNYVLTPLKVFTHPLPPAPPQALSVSAAHHDLFLALPLMLLKLSQP